MFTKAEPARDSFIVVVVVVGAESEERAERAERATRQAGRNQTRPQTEVG